MVEILMAPSRRSPVRIALTAFAGLGAHVARRLELRARVNRWGRRFFLGLLGLTTAGLLAYAWLTHRSAVELERLLGEIRAKGEPTTPAEMAPPRLPAEENAAPLYARAFALAVA